MVLLNLQVLKHLKFWALVLGVWSCLASLVVALRYSSQATIARIAGFRNGQVGQFSRGLDIVREKNCNEKCSEW